VGFTATLLATEPVQYETGWDSQPHCLRRRREKIVPVTGFEFL